MFLIKRLNNNAVIAEDDGGNEKILIGCGIGFQSKTGSVVDENKIEKVFALADSETTEQVKELLKNIPIEHMKLADDIVSYAKIHVSGKINENILLALSDHIYMAVERKKQGIEIKNALLWDIQRYYPMECKERFGEDLSEGEAGFVALHIVNAQMDLGAKNVKEITAVIQEIQTIARMMLKIDLDVNSVYYYRFISHLRFFAERMFSGKTYADEAAANLSELIRAQYPKAHRCGVKIASFIRDTYRYRLANDEIAYLSIHIARLARAAGKRSASK